MAQNPLSTYQPNANNRSQLSGGADDSINVTEVRVVGNKTYSGKENWGPRDDSNQRRSIERSRRSQERPARMPASGPAIKGAESIHDQIIDSYRRQLQANVNLDSDYQALQLKIKEV